MALSLPPGVTQDPNTGFYILTNAEGKTTRTGAQTQEELNTLAASFSSGRPTTVTIINPVSGNPVTATFDPAAIIQQESDRNTALIADRAARQASNDAWRAANPDLNLTFTEPPPAQGTVISPAAYAKATTATDTVTNIPSILPLSPAPNSVQPPVGINAPAPQFGIQQFADGTSIQTLPDGSTIITDIDGGITATNAPIIAPQQLGLFDGISSPLSALTGKIFSNPISTSISSLSALTGKIFSNPISTSISSFFTPAPVITDTPQTVFSQAQLDWLGGADRTDPSIIRRLLLAVPNTPTPPLVQNSSPEFVGDLEVDNRFVGDLAVEPQQQPADDFAGLDEAIELQKQPDLGELGINTDQLPQDQIQIDENGEPLPEATPDEKINAQLQADNPYSQAQSDAELEENNADIQAQLAVEPQQLPVDAPEADPAFEASSIALQKQPDPGEVQDDATGVDEAIALQKQPDLGELGINTDLTNFVGDIPIDPQLQAEEQPADEFAGLDEAIALQKQPDLGELGINTDQLAPPIDSDAEIRRQLEINEAEEPVPGGGGEGDSQTFQEQKQAEEQPNNFVGDIPIDPQLQAEEQPNNFVGDIPIDPQLQEESVSARAKGLSPISSSLADTRSQATQQDGRNANLGLDWRVKLSLAKDFDYLYKAENSGILAPLRATGGIVFPYTPSIQVTYAAHYDPSEITHSNYKIFQYKSSSVDQVNITCDFTAQDTYEANYLLAVIHFLRSVTKMFYGNDNLPKPGTPPPLCYLTGMGEYQFNNHPLVVSTFTMNLPNEVDYIRATPNPSSPPGVDQSAANNKNNDIDPAAARKFGSCVPERGDNPPTKFTSNNKGGTVDPTYVPTKMQIQITAYPIVTRNDISNKFSLRDYATGALINRKSGGGMW